MAGRLENKVTLISGTASGMGRAAALRFAEEGALVVGCDVNVEGNKETAEQVRSMGFDMVELSPLDSSDLAEAQRWIAAAIDAYGRIDVLYNNAAAVRHGGIEDPIEDWHVTMRGVLDLVFYPTYVAWPHLKQSGGVIINIGSTAAHSANAGMLAYSAGKGAVLAMTRSLAAEGAPFGIRVCSISPGPIEVRGAEHYSADPSHSAAMTGKTLLQRMGHPREVANLGCFLASEEASFITGVDVLVDGGARVAGTRAPTKGGPDAGKGGSEDWLVDLMKEKMRGAGAS